MQVILRYPDQGDSEYAANPAYGKIYLYIYDHEIYSYEYKAPVVTIASHYVTIALHYVTIALHYVTIALHYVTIALHYVTIALHYVTIALHYVTIAAHVNAVNTVVKDQWSSVSCEKHPLIVDNMKLIVGFSNADSEDHAARPSPMLSHK